jgi:hypothetical protein
MALEQELAVYDRQLPDLLKEHEGQYVLIHGETIDSFWQSEDDAYVAGCERFGIEPFLVMPVVREQKPVFVPYPVITRE